MEQILRYLPFIIPLVILQLILIVIALVDLSKREKVRGLPKWAWVIIIVIGELLGPIIYLLVGREE